MHRRRRKLIDKVLEEYGLEPPDRLTDDDLFTETGPGWRLRRLRPNESWEDA